MDQSLRLELYNTVVQCRRILEENLALQLEGVYGVHPDGTLEPLAHLHLDAVGRADRQAIEATLAHWSGGKSGVERELAVERYVRESAFTFLNRLAALKLMEHPSRAIIQPSVGQDEQSRGFQQFTLLSPEALRAGSDVPAGSGYRLYLELLFDDLSQVLGALFDPSLPTAILFPTQPCLKAVLALLNAPALAAVWGEDETIGWIYQYFTPTELRDEARKASSAPRSSYEMAFRNQFYTPRYVVAFLADNSLGRLWQQMRNGDTGLAEQCEYLIQTDVKRESVKREDGENAVESEHYVSRFTFQASRPKRDPRELRVIDLACGSGHFLLYSFGLLQTIYEEAYDDADLGPALQHDYPDADAYRRAVPGLILEHNLYGIDIDLRAAQIAGLALWLRAQRAFGELGLKVRARPQVRREQIHIVCAAPMPGEYDLLGEFCRDLQPAVLGNLLLDIWERMKLTGEVGSLLKVEQEIEAAIRKAREQLAALPLGIQLTLFGPERPQQLAAPMRRIELEDDVFWAEAADRVVAALRDYAARAKERQAADPHAVTQRLFAMDAEQGIAFIDLMRRRYDVVLINPPFGAASIKGKDYIARAYPRTKNDLYAAFVERALELLHPGGMLGAITSRTGFFLTSFQRWREEILLQEARLVTMADLGYGVLDTAMVETAAYVVEKVKRKT